MPTSGQASDGRIVPACTSTSAATRLVEEAAGDARWQLRQRVARRRTRGPLQAVAEPARWAVLRVGRGDAPARSRRSIQRTAETTTGLRKVPSVNCAMRSRFGQCRARLRRAVALMRPGVLSRPLAPGVPVRGRAAAGRPSDSYAEARQLGMRRRVGPGPRVWRHQTDSKFPATRFDFSCLNWCQSIAVLFLTGASASRVPPPPSGTASRRGGHYA